MACPEQAKTRGRQAFVNGDHPDVVKKLRRDDGIDDKLGDPKALAEKRSCTTGIAPPNPELRKIRKVESEPPTFVGCP